MSAEELANGTPEANQVAQPVAGQEKKEEGGKNGYRGRKDEPPIEELYDLSKPIPKVAKPDKEQHEKELDELNDSFETMKEERRKVQEKIEGAMDKDKKSEFGKEREGLQQLRSKKNALIEEKKAIRSKLDIAKTQADKIMKDKKDAKSNIRFGSVEEIDKEIQKLQRRQETTSMSLSEEKRIIKEMDALKASKKFVVEIKSKESAMENVKEQRKNIQGLLNAKDKEIDAVSKLIDEKQAVLKVLQDKESNKKNELQVWFKERDELRKKISEVLKEKDALRAKFREANNEWYNFQRAVRAQKKMQYEEEKKRREAEHQEYLKKLEEEEAKKIPYEEEKALCDYLADYLTRTYLSGSNASQKVEKTKDVVAVKDDPFAGFKPVGKKDDEEYFGKGKGKKKRNRASKKQDKVVGPFTLSVDTFEQFGWLSLTPPTSIDMVEASVKELREKKEWYSKQPRGSVPTASQIRKANEKAAEKIRKNGDVGEAAKTSSQKGKFSLSSDDFAPLGGGSSTGVSALNSTWGQKPAESTPPVVSENEGATTEEA